MNFLTRAVIALLTGVGAGALGFWVVWRFVEVVLGDYPAIGYDAWLVGGIFAPGALVPLVVFRALSQQGGQKPAAPFVG